MMAPSISDYAAEHGLEVRNLHDGRSVPPANPTGRKLSRGYGSPEDRCDAIPCLDGYVSDEANGTLGIYVRPENRQHLMALVSKLRAAGAVIGQIGDGEAGGSAPADRLAAVLRLLHPYRNAPKSTRVQKHRVF